MLRDVEVSRLAVGMYVAELDRPWLETPFPLQGFFITDADDIARLQRYCEFVRVDPRRFDFRLGNAAAAGASGAAVPHLRPVSSMHRKRAERERKMVDAVTYEDSSTVEVEFAAARTALDRGREVFAKVWQDLVERHRVSVNQVAEAVDPLVESVLRNKDALVTLLRVQRIDPNVHEHCIALAIWASLLGRQLGLPPDQIRTLALGCSLVDVGMIRITPDILDKADPLTDEETAEYRAHVGHSLEMLDDAENVAPAVHETVRWHHERMDGSGYPDCLVGNEIPMFARIAGSWTPMTR